VAAPNAMFFKSTHGKTEAVVTLLGPVHIGLRRGVQGIVA
jgi:hypothetical protein